MDKSTRILTCKLLNLALLVSEMTIAECTFNYRGDIDKVSVTLYPYGFAPGCKSIYLLDECCPTDKAVEEAFNKLTDYFVDAEFKEENDG